MKSERAMFRPKSSLAPLRVLRSLNGDKEAIQKIIDTVHSNFPEQESKVMRNDPVFKDILKRLKTSSFIGVSGALAFFQIEHLNKNYSIAFHISQDGNKYEICFGDGVENKLILLIQEFSQLDEIKNPQEKFEKQAFLSSTLKKILSEFVEILSIQKDSPHIIKKPISPNLKEVIDQHSELLQTILGDVRLPRSPSESNVSANSSPFFANPSVENPSVERPVECQCVQGGQQKKPRFLLNI